MNRRNRLAVAIAAIAALVCGVLLALTLGSESLRYRDFPRPPSPAVLERALGAVPSTLRRLSGLPFAAGRDAPRPLRAPVVAAARLVPVARLAPGTPRGAAGNPPADRSRIGPAPTPRRAPVEVEVEGRSTPLAGSPAPLTGPPARPPQDPMPPPSNPPSLPTGPPTPPPRGTDPGPTLPAGPEPGEESPPPEEELPPEEPQRPVPSGEEEPPELPGAQPLDSADQPRYGAEQGKGAGPTPER